MNLENVKKILGDRFSFTADDTHAVLNTLNLPESANVLDVGTGPGNMAIMLALHGYRVITGEPEHDDSVYSKQDWLARARKVQVDHLIRFNAFDAAKMPFEADRFEGVFFLGSLHHIPEDDHEDVFKECVRVTKRNGVICFLEPRKKLIHMIRQNDPSHPEAADPENRGIQLGLSCKRTKGVLFDGFIFSKNSV